MTHQDLLQTFAHLAPQQRAQIIAKLKAQGVDLPGDDQAQSEPGSVGQMSPAIPRIDRSAPIPLSFPQEQLWFLHQLEPENPSYHERIGMLLQGSLDVDRLEHAIHTVVRRHESLRTTFKSRDGKNRDGKSREDSDEDRVSDPHQAEQVIHPFDADLFGLTHQPVSPQEAHALEALTPDHTVLDETTELAKRIDAHSWRPFDLQRAPLWRLVLFSTAPVADVLIHTGNHLLLFVIHHMCAWGAIHWGHSSGPGVLQSSGVNGRALYRAP
ncbi:hypothetical protein C2W62_14405 [Candidatus Entotheonella serta]|nr:hypothetical protein C2W62_14405 [Candidatus Entotheonella serta]